MFWGSSPTNNISLVHLQQLFNPLLKFYNVNERVCLAGLVFARLQTRFRSKGPAKHCCTESTNSIIAFQKELFFCDIKAFGVFSLVRIAQDCCGFSATLDVFSEEFFLDDFQTNSILKPNRNVYFKDL